VLRRPPFGPYSSQLASRASRDGRDGLAAKRRAVKSSKIRG
jgi:hypothetical protein